MQTQFAIDGTDLRNLATNIRTLNGWDSWPGRRGRNFEVPYIHGESSVARKFVPARDLALTMVILPSNAAGIVTTDPASHVQENVDTLLSLLWKPNSLLTVTRTMPDGTTRTIDAEAIDASEIVKGKGAIDREFIIRLRLPDPFWRVTSPNSPTNQNVLNTSTGFNVTTLGNAPIADAVVRFTANGSSVQNPKIEWTPPGFTDPEFLQYSGTIAAGDWVEFDCGRRIAVTDTGARADVGVRFSYPWWLELDPASTIAMTATCTASSDWDVDITWNDKYF